MFFVDMEKTFVTGSGSFCLRVAFASDSRTVVVFGPSGSGKSLTLKLMAGLLSPERGRVAIDGRTLFDAAAKVNLPARMRRIGYVFQDYALFPHMNVRANIAFGMEPAPKEKMRENVEGLLARFELEGVAQSLPERVCQWHP